MWVTLDEADTYLESVMITEPWDLSTDPLRTKAIKASQKIIEALNTVGILDENNEPVALIKDATIEIALKLLDGVDPETELYNYTIKEMEFDRLKQTNKSGETPLHVIAGVPSVIAFNILRRFMPDLTTVRLSRTD